MMDNATANILCDLNTRFYAENAATFSATRAGGWPGWGRLIEELYGRGCAWADTQRAGTCSAERAFDVRVVDAACGNLRFERWLTETLPDVDFHVVALDSCEALAEGAPVAGVDFRPYDLLDETNPTWSDLSHFADIVVCFGFAHHVPGAEARACLVRALVDCVAPGGFIAISLWRFADNEGMRAKAEATTRAGLATLGLAPSAIEEGDYLLGWRDSSDALRYCHSFNDADIDALVAAAEPAAVLRERFRADGRTGALNEYLLFQRRNV